MVKKKLFIPILIVLIVGTTASAIVQSDGNPTYLLAFLIIGFFYIVIHIPTKNQK